MLYLIPMPSRSLTLVLVGVFYLAGFSQKKDDKIRYKRGYTSHSILESGAWYKIPVKDKGIYKLSYGYLKNKLKIDLSGIDPHQIRIFGNGGQLLPANNNLPRPDDLGETENSVLISDGGTAGKFDEDDYILFYGQSTVKWHLNAGGKYEHTVHPYSDTAYYFISIGNGNSKQVSSSSPTGTVNATVSSFQDYYLHEKDLGNVLSSGTVWYGEAFEFVTAQPFDVTLKGLEPGTPIFLKSAAIGQSSVPSALTLTVNGNKFLHNFSGVDVTVSTQLQASYDVPAGSFTAPENFTLNYSYSKPNAESKAWLDYFELNYTHSLKYEGSPLFFRDASNPGNGFKQFQLTGLSNGRVWNVTDPYNIRQLSTGTSFIDSASRAMEYIAFQDGDATEPLPGRPVANQNLHAINSANFIIVSHPAFLEESQRLADYHKATDGLSTVIVTPEQVYNEFSSGVPDIIAVRDFAKMLWAKPDSLKYLLLMGDGSYDNKARISNNTNYILTFQSPESFDPLVSYTSDDYYGLFTGVGDFSGQETPSIGIGRIPCQTAEQAHAVVNKILRYKSTFGDWRNQLCFVSDNFDPHGAGQDFIIHTEDLTKVAKQSYPLANINKIFTDAYKQDNGRFPQARQDILNQVQKGALIINYYGHGGEFGWANERILTVPDIQGFTNANMPLFVTATCEFSRYDNPRLTSAGEYVLLNPHGGGIALFTTVRVEFVNVNDTVNKNFLLCAFPKNGITPRLGDIFRRTKLLSSKNGYGSMAKNFSLLGDPALTLNYPRQSVRSLKFNTGRITAGSDTLKGLAKVTIEGEITDNNGNAVNDFNGILYPSIFDKPVTIQTITEGEPGNPVLDFSLQKDMIYKGKVSVNKGAFKFSFIVPKDVNYKFGHGRISYYAADTVKKFDAAGFDTSIVVGGFQTGGKQDNNGPEMKLYLNDKKFSFGGITNESPRLLLLLKDSSGINTVGHGIGHDLVANLDNNTKNAFILNEYYEADLDSYQSGSVTYPLSKLAEGRHALKVKAWDVYDNSNESYTEFVVANSAKIALTHILNYPNPFTTHTSFYFEHNKPGMPLEVQIQIFTITGKLVKTINTGMSTEGFRSDAIDWDGKDDYGSAIGRGVYIYRLRVRTNGEIAGDKYEKLVILK